jgi:hypothetical protein
MAYFEQGSPAMQQLTAIVDRLEQMVTLGSQICSMRWRWCAVPRPGPTQAQRGIG